MIRLLPQKRIKAEVALPASMDLEFVFESETTRPTVERVIKFLRPVYENFTGRSFEDISRENTKTEEFLLQMPTEAAFASELRLAGAILDHADGKVSDLEIKAVLDEFIATHTFIYFEEKRECKKGDFDKWAEGCELVYIREINTDFGFTCNFIQAYLVKFLHDDLNFKMVRL